MRRLERLMDECKMRALNCSITYQRMNDYSVEIYTGYGKSYTKYYYSDGHLSAQKAIKKGLKYINKKSK